MLTEGELLKLINQRLPKDVQARYDLLIAKRIDETLTEGELHELINISESIENQDVERLRYRIELAKIRNVPLPELAKSLKRQSKRR